MTRASFSMASQMDFVISSLTEPDGAFYKVPNYVSDVHAPKVVAWEKITYIAPSGTR